MRVAICYNLKKDLPEQQGTVLPDDFYAECDDMETIDAIRGALEKHHKVALIEADQEAYDKLKTLRPDIVFNIAEGVWGDCRESQIPAILEMLRIPYTGSDPLTLALCLDKARAKEVLSYRGVPTAPFCIAARPDDLSDAMARLNFPLIVKPLMEGSSKGIIDASVTKGPDELEKRVKTVWQLYGQAALIEEFLQGREFTVAIIGNGPETLALPIVEIRFEELPPGANPIYSYEAKWVWDDPREPLDIFCCPAELSPAEEKALKAVCIKAYNVMRCRDWCRIDVRLDAQGVPNIIELNPLPGILPDPSQNSCFPKAARAAGLDYSALINLVLDIACRRYGLIS